MADETCSTCGGSGTVTDEVWGWMRQVICPTCKGTGKAG